MQLIRSTIPSPIGDITLIHDGTRIHICEFADRDSRVQRQLTQHYPHNTVLQGNAPAAFSDGFAAYFAGERDALEVLPTSPRGSAFQQKVWAALKAVRAGNTASYKDLAAQVGSVARAVGQANGKNPISLIHPCHRIIGANGTLTGYAGGVDRKAWLLTHEKATLGL